MQQFTHAEDFHSNRLSSSEAVGFPAHLKGFRGKSSRVQGLCGLGKPQQGGGG